MQKISIKYSVRLWTSSQIPQKVIWIYRMSDFSAKETLNFLNNFIQCVNTSRELLAVGLIQKNSQRILKDILQELGGIRFHKIENAKQLIAKTQFSIRKKKRSVWYGTYWWKTENGSEKHLKGENLLSEKKSSSKRFQEVGRKIWAIQCWTYRATWLINTFKKFSSRFPRALDKTSTWLC